MNVMAGALSFLVGSVVSLYVFVLLARLFMHKHRMSAINPLVRFVINVTAAPLRPLQRVLPECRGYDSAIIVLLLAIKWIEIELNVWSQQGQWPPFLAAMVIALAYFASLMVDVYFYAIIITAVLSWLPMLPYFPVRDLIDAIAGPPLRWVQRLLPTFSGIDFSPLVLLLGLQVVDKVVEGYLSELIKVLLG